MDKNEIHVGDMVLIPAKVLEVYGGFVRVQVNAVNSYGEPRMMGGCISPSIIKRKVGVSALKCAAPKGGNVGS